MADQFYTSAEALTFRRYAMEEFHRPSVDLKHLGQDTNTDFLRLALESVRDHMTHSFRTKRRDGTGFRVYPAYLDCISPNAFAGARDDVHLCGVNIGLAVMCFEFALFCLSQPTLFRDVGNADGERAPKPVDGYPPGFWMRESGRALEENVFLDQAQGLIPSDPERYGTAVFLSVLMIRFIWLHELAHCLNGHVGLVHGIGDETIE